VERVHDLVPFAFVQDPERSAAFYRRLGMEIVDREEEGGVVHWAFLRGEDACLMLARASEPIDPGAQAVLFYLYARDLGRLRDQLLADGLEVGEIKHPDHMRAGEMRVADPDGYALFIGELADSPHRQS
jgi:catechol 2,3-dioxygenase-like lactoylglutathione lyase family enzyme